ncbi:hypothetical protein SAMN05421505_11274 [Sinosporangium album]|uniref:Uncharacterized protein n=1 Tax=Sinosporangium album TaxID=504805 RepID=A0A1G8A9Z1_9ACTN|nr:hypothetical protein [Sinosporangium album]SDH17772.1 hypothetical protein SAMN05421505_11274 [Sinosporangium album]
MSGTRSKRLGTTFESAVVKFLKNAFRHVRRNGNRFGAKDRGDLAGVPNWTLQLKNTRDTRWGPWFEATAEQAANAGTRWWAVIRKTRGKSTEQALFVMPLWKARELLSYIRELENTIKKFKKWVF